MKKKGETNCLSLKQYHYKSYLYDILQVYQSYKCGASLCIHYCQSL